MNEKREIARKYLGRGGAGIMNTLMKPFASTMTYDSAKDRPVNGGPIENTYDVRGMKVGDKDLTEAEKILYAEISNRSPEKQKFEVRHIANTAVNRMAAKNKSLTEVLQEPYQYQGYAPKGVTRKGGKVAKSEYQLVSENHPAVSQEKLRIIREALAEMKGGKFEDTTGGAQFYVHASDGTMWLGKTIKEAKQRAHEHERSIKAPRSQFGTTTGLPNY